MVMTRENGSIRQSRHRSVVGGVGVGGGVAIDDDDDGGGSSSNNNDL